MSLEFERVQKLMSNFPGKVPKWEEAGPSPHGGWEEEDFGGRACSPGCEWDNVQAFSWAKWTPQRHLGLSHLVEFQPKSTAQQGEMRVERVYMEFALE